MTTVTIKLKKKTSAPSVPPSVAPSIPPPPPPPPLPSSNNVEKNLNETKIKDTKKIKLQLTECLWAKKYPEIQKGFYLSKICLNEPPKICKFYKINSILQNGPTCGLTALSMIFNGKPDTEIIQKKAVEMNMTKNGEMFSANNIYELFHHFLEESDLKINKNNYKAILFHKNMNCNEIKDYLLKHNAIILFAFDTDANFKPCLRNGVKAHWGLIIGCAVDNLDRFYVIVRHGKAKNMAVWDINDIAISNSNLNEVDNEKRNEFLLPKGGISGEYGLKNQWIVIVGLETEIVQIV